MERDFSEDVDTRLIGYCHRGSKEAEKLFESLIAHDRRVAELPERTIFLSQEEHDEFVVRFSSEVETERWESKQWKDQSSLLKH